MRALQAFKNIVWAAHFVFAAVFCDEPLFYFYVITTEMAIILTEIAVYLTEIAIILTNTPKILTERPLTNSNTCIATACGAFQAFKNIIWAFYFVFAAVFCDEPLFYFYVITTEMAIILTEIAVFLTEIATILTKTPKILTEPSFTPTHQKRPLKNNRFSRVSIFYLKARQPMSWR